MIWEFEMAYTYSEWLKENLEKELSNSELLTLWNNYSEDEQIHDNDSEFFATFFEDGYSIARAIWAGNYVFTDNYVFFNRMGNLETFNNLTDENSPFHLDSLISFVEDNQYQLQHYSWFSFISKDAYEDDIAEEAE